MRGKHPRLVAAVGVTTIALALGAPGGTGTAAAHGHPHTGAVPIKQATFSGYASGTYLHAHVLQLDTTRVVNANVAGSAAAVKQDAGKPALAKRADELGRYVVNPAAPGTTTSWGRGVALEAGLVEEVPAEEASLLSLAGVATQEAPPTMAEPAIESIELDLDPLLYLDLLRGEASAKWNADDPCIYKAPEPPTRFALGPPPEHHEADFGFGSAHVADVELLDLEGNAEEQEGLEGPLLATNVTTGQGIKKRAVGWTSSQSYLAGQYKEDGTLVGQDYGIASEVRATLLPITLLSGGEDEVTIEVLGPWRLVANAGGLPGTGWIHFGPEATEPNQPILRISHRRILPDGTFEEENDDILTVEDLASDDGLRIHIDGVADISLGEGPRPISTEDEDPHIDAVPTDTEVSAAADILRIELLDSAEPPSVELAEVRLGHMEVEAKVPAGGLACKPPEPPKPPLPRTGIEDVSDQEDEVTDILPVIDLPLGQGQAVGEATGQETGRESLKAEAVARRQTPIYRAIGLFSAVIAILVASGAMLLRRRGARS